MHLTLTYKEISVKLKLQPSHTRQTTNKVSGNK